MTALALDFRRKSNRISRLGWLILLAGMVCTGMAIQSFVKLNETKADVEATLARLERKRVPVVRGDMSDRDTKRYAEEIKLANSVAERLTLPWLDLFQAVESGGSSRVALLSLEPDAQKKTVRMTAEAKDKADMLAYVRKLNASQRLVNVHLLDHQVQRQTPGQPVRFSMQAGWAVQKREEH
jgi:Tfp pilus assembly protein PilN